MAHDQEKGQKAIPAADHVMKSTVKGSGSKQYYSHEKLAGSAPKMKKTL